MNIIQERFGEPVSLGARTRAMFRKASPYWQKMAWWAMLVLCVVVMALDVNAWTDGAIGAALMWIHTTVFQRFPSFAFIGGMLATYYLFLKGGPTEP